MSSPPLARRPVVALAATLVVCLLMSACGGSEYRYVENRTNGVYFKVPDDWQVFGKEQILKGTSLTEDQRDRLRYLAAFDADPQPSLEHGFIEGSHPFGLVRVRTLSIEERDSFSLAILRNELVNMDEIVDEELGNLNILSKAAITKPKGARGARHVYNVRTDTTNFTVDQTGLVDAETNTVYFLIVGCTSACYDQNRNTITEIADSWTVKES